MSKRIANEVDCKQPKQLTDIAADQQRKISSEQNGKMSIYEYEQKYTRRQNVRSARLFLYMGAALVGVVLFVCLFFLTMRVYEINEYAGYGVGAACLVLFICVFIVPLVKILKTGAFVTNVTVMTAKQAKRHNKKLRHEISEKIIDFTGKVEGTGWYDSEVVGRLAIALKLGDEEKLKSTLTELYQGSVKRNAKDMIFKCSLKCAAYSAISQAAKVDTALVIFLNLQLIKDLVFLYGFRPSDARLARIVARVLQNALIAYGIGGMNIGHSVVQTMGSAVKGIPILGNAIAAIVDSSVQGLANGTLTTVIGYQTIRYLNTEYRLQNILDGIDVGETPEELAEACNNLEKELKSKKRGARTAV